MGVERKQQELEKLEALLLQMEQEEAALAQAEDGNAEKIFVQEELMPNAPMEESDDHETSIEASQQHEIAKPEQANDDEPEEEKKEEEESKSEEDAKKEDKEEPAKEAND